MKHLVRSRLSVFCSSVFCCVLVSCQATTSDSYRLQGSRSFLDGYPARVTNGRVNVVVEIPAGTNAKWEVDKSDGSIAWEQRGSGYRVVKYLGYPANYGMVPSTLLPKELGGDGDPLDVLLLGPTQKRGSVVSARLIGVLTLLDGGEQDDKLVAVADGSVFEGVASIRELDAQFPGVTRILEIWMSNYKGPGKMKSKGFAEVEEANRVLEASIKAFASPK